MSIIKEKLLKDYPEAVGLKSTDTIMKQMQKNICKIMTNDGKATGFLCRIPFPDNNNKLTVLITNNHVFKDLEKEITIEYDDRYIKIDLKNRKKYTNEKYDITIIEIKASIDNIDEFLEIDETIMIKGATMSFISESIYLLHFPKKEKLVSYGIIKNIPIDKNYVFNHFCCTEEGSSGAPIINLTNNKVIGLHIGSYEGTKNCNRGSFLNEPIKEFYAGYKQDRSIREEKIFYENSINKSRNEINEKNNKTKI